MKISIFRFVVIGVCWLYSLKSYGQQSSPLNESAIRLTVSQIENAWNRHNAKDFAAGYAQEADFTNVIGESEHGRTKVEAFHAPMFATIFKNSHVKQTVSKIRFIKPDVAAVDVKWEMTGAIHSNGEAWPDRKGLINYIMVPEDGTWKVLIMHNSEF
jgi:uncharacterized protein (TIGR02246 family)